ncbi:glycosyltransferase family 4 protein [Flagellimonas sp. S174]|uniref:glycosyltransferase family 4 protein n=1 Tax=Flagellimonas sp. S174 TaxID=3410790 RepID=UPI003BF5E9C2
MENILLITSRSDIGGGPVHLNYLINKLDRTKYRIFLACPFQDDFFLKWSKNQFIVSMLELPHRKINIVSILKLNNFIRKNKIVLVHSHGKGAGIYSRICKFFNKKVKVIHTFHGISNIILNQTIKGRIRNVYSEILLSKYTDYFIAVSKGESSLAKTTFKIGENNMITIYNGVEKPAVNNNEKNNHPLIISVVRFSPEKNMELSFEIAKELTHFRFLWIGEGETKKLLEEKSRIQNVKNIDFLDFREHPFKEIDSNKVVFLSTSRGEGLPMALIEALSIGLPVVATDVIGNNEVVIDGYNGFLFNPANLNKIYQLLKRIFHEEDLYQRLRSNALMDYGNRFFIDKMIGKTEKLYDQIIG